MSTNDLSTISKRRRWLGLMLAFVALAPTAYAIKASADESDDSASDEAEHAPTSTNNAVFNRKQKNYNRASENLDTFQKRKLILSKITNDPTVLINVTDREMPASPDIFNLGKRSTSALTRCLADNVNNTVRERCASMLGRMGDKRALAALQVALEDWEPFVRTTVVKALQHLPDTSSIEKLAKLLHRSDEDFSVKLEVIDALGVIGDIKALQLVREQFRKNDAGTQSRAFSAIWRAHHRMARSTFISDIVFAFNSKDESVIVKGIEAATELRATELVKSLLKLVEGSSPHVRNRAIHALGLIGDKSAIKPLVALLPQVREARTLNNIAFALERLDPASFYSTIPDVIEHKQAVIRLNAAYVLGDVKRREGRPFLEKALSDPSELVRVGAIAALAKLGDKNSIPAIEKFVTDPNPGLREEAIYAIQKLSGQKRNDLVYEQLFSSRKALTKRRAAIELAKANDPRVQEYILKCLEQHECSFRQVGTYVQALQDKSVTARLFFSWARGNDSLTQYLSQKRLDGVLNFAVGGFESAFANGQLAVGRRMIHLLGSLGNASVTPKLREHISDSDTWTRIQTGVALSRLGDASAEASLLSNFNELPAIWLSPFANKLSEIDEPNARARLSLALAKQEKDADVYIALAAARTHLRWSPEQAFFRFLDALASPSPLERDLAERYLKRERSQTVTSLIRRALARESRESTRDRLRKILDTRG